MVLITARWENIHEPLSRMISGVWVSAFKVQRSCVSFAGGMKIWCSLLHDGRIHEPLSRMISGVRVSAIKVQRLRVSFAGSMKIWCSLLHEGRIYVNSSAA